MNREDTISLDAPAGAVEDAVAVFGPASLSNMGPGFDALGLCLADMGDEIVATHADEPGIHLVLGEGAVPWTPPSDPTTNTAYISAERVRRLLAPDAGIRLLLRKGIPMGSGVGGSAASAVAGAWAVNKLLGAPLSKEDVAEAALDGEEEASGGRHGDNVLPALFGGLVLVSSSEPSRYRRIPLPHALPLALLLPEVEILTKHARDMLPDEVGLRDAVHNASELAFLVEAFRCGDWEEVGRGIMQDRLVEPVRATLLPCFDAVREASLEAGAFGCAITGSGPAMFAVAESHGRAGHVLEAMIDATQRAGIAASGIVTEAGRDGVL